MFYGNEDPHLLGLAFDLGDLLLIGIVEDLVVDAVGRVAPGELHLSGLAADNGRSTVERRVEPGDQLLASTRFEADDVKLAVGDVGLAAERQRRPGERNVENLDPEEVA